MQHLVIAPPGRTAPPELHLEYAISRLPDDQRTVLCLFHYERLSLEQIAVVLGLSEDEVAILFFWANANLGARASLPDSAYAA